MTRMRSLAVVLMVILLGCAGKENLIVLTPNDGGSVGAMELHNESGTVILDEEGKAILVRDRRSVPSASSAVSAAATQDIFRDALAAQPLPPQSFLLYFEFGSDTLTTESQELMAAILNSIRQRDSQDISVVGHTDRAGDRDYNLNLSLQRAKAVHDLLVEQGISADFIQLSSHGEGNPLIPTADHVAEAKNRRVEVMVR